MFECLVENMSTSEGATVSVQTPRCRVSSSWVLPLETDLNCLSTFFFCFYFKFFFAHLHFHHVPGPDSPCTSQSFLWVKMKKMPEVNDVYVRGKIPPFMPLKLIRDTVLVPYFQEIRHLPSQISMAPIFSG